MAGDNQQLMRDALEAINDLSAKLAKAEKLLTQREAELFKARRGGTIQETIASVADPIAKSLSPPVGTAPYHETMIGDRQEDIKKRRADALTKGAAHDITERVRNARDIRKAAR